MLKKISYEGHDFEYDPKEVLSYKNVKRLSRAKDDVSAFFDVCEAVFAGKDEEYAEILGDDVEKLGELIGLAASNEGRKAKN